MQTNQDTEDALEEIGAEVIECNIKLDKIQLMLERFINPRIGAASPRQFNGGTSPKKGPEDGFGVMIKEQSPLHRERSFSPRPTVGNATNNDSQSNGDLQRKTAYERANEYDEFIKKQESMRIGNILHKKKTFGLKEMIKEKQKFVEQKNKEREEDEMYEDDLDYEDDVGFNDENSSEALEEHKFNLINESDLVAKQNNDTSIVSKNNDASF